MEVGVHGVEGQVGDDGDGDRVADVDTCTTATSSQETLTLHDRQTNGE